MGGGGAPAAAEPMEEENVGNLAAMTEEGQIALAIQLFMAESAGPEGIFPIFLKSVNFGANP